METKYDTVFGELTLRQIFHDGWEGIDIILDGVSLAEMYCYTLSSLGKMTNEEAAKFLKGEDLV